MVDVNLKVPALEKLVDYAASGIGADMSPEGSRADLRAAARPRRRHPHDGT